MKLLTKCSWCHQYFNVTENLSERLLDAEKLTLTVLVCPNCSNEVVTQVDNEETLRLHQAHLVLLKKMGERQFQYGKPTPAQKSRSEDYTQRILKMRNDLNSKYNHTSYQFDGKEHKLDIHVPNMKLSEV